VDEVLGPFPGGNEVLDLMGDVHIHPDGVGSQVGPGPDAGVGRLVDVMVDLLVGVAGIGDLPVVQFRRHRHEIGLLQPKGAGEPVPMRHFPDRRELPLEASHPLIDDLAHSRFPGPSSFVRNP
jgi:hypothetical protein